MSWESLKNIAKKELSTIPQKEQIVFEKIFGLKWSQFEQFIISLAGQSYEKISSVQDKMATLGDLSESEVMELTMMATLNKTQYKSSKIEYYQICRLLHTKK